MDKDNAGIIDSLYNETLGKQYTHVEKKRKERVVKQKTKKQGTCGESGKEAEGIKHRGLFEGMGGNNRKRKKIKGSTRISMHNNGG